MVDLQKQTIDLAKNFSTLKKKEYQFMDLIEEVGELATAMMYFEKIKKGRLNGKIKKEDISDALSDILFDLFLISDQYNINLEDEYKKMLKRLKLRVKSGEFRK
jgi:NTP pyrophosphatase (non-canonical NTP hydrolase)